MQKASSGVLVGVSLMATIAARALLLRWMAQQHLTTIAVGGTAAAALALLVVVRGDNLMQLNWGCTPSRATRREVRTDVVANPGVTMAEAGQRVLAIDADLRSPQLAERLGIRTELGLSDVLDGATLVEQAIRRHPAGLELLAGGSPRVNPGEILDSPLFDDLLETVRDTYDL